MMRASEERYLTLENETEKLVRIELLFSPLLLCIPLCVSFVMIWAWFSQGYLLGSTGYDGQLLVALVILIGNLLFAIPFLRSLIVVSRRRSR